MIIVINNQICRIIIVIFIGIIPVTQLNAEKKELFFHTGVSKSGEISIFDKIAFSRLEEAFKRSSLNLKPVLRPVPSQRALMLTNSKGDGELMRLKNIKKLAPEVTNNFVIIPEIIMTNNVVVFTKNLNFTVKGWESLKPYNNGVQRGIRLFDKTPNRVDVNHISQAFQMLDRNRIDTVLIFKIVGLQIVKKEKYKGVKILEPPLWKIEAYPFLHKKHKKIAGKIAAALKSMKKDGSFQKIRRQILNDL